MAVGGESAGGNLATVVSMMARDRNGTLPLHQLLVYPVTNSGMNVTHEFFGMGSVVPEAKEAEQFAADELKKAFAVKH